jgi:hypothetical protein
MISGRLNLLVYASAIPIIKGMKTNISLAMTEASIDDSQKLHRSTGNDACRHSYLQRFSHMVVASWSVSRTSPW